MAKHCSIIPMCDIHHDDVAQALCHCHKKLLCLSCVLEKAKSTECTFTEIRKITGENDTLLLEWLSVRQTATKKERLITEHENKTRILKDKLEKEVTVMHDKLAKRLDEMKENCLRLIDDQANYVTSASKLNKQRLASFERTINKNIDRLSAESVDDVTEKQTTLEEVKTELMKNVPDKDTEPEGESTPNDHLHDLIMQSNTSLGKVYLFDHERYAQIDVSNGACDGSSKPAYASSDEIVYDAEKQIIPVTVTPNENAGSLDSLKVSAEKESKSSKSNENQAISDKLNTTSPDEKSEKKRGGIFKWFSTDKKKSYQLDEQEEKMGSNTKDNQGKSIAGKTILPSESSKHDTESIYEDSTFQTPTNPQPKYLINKTVKASALKKHFTSACKFSKLVDLGDGYVVMLSEIHNSLVLVGTGGQVFGKKTIKEGKHAVAAVGNQEVAVIAESGLQVTKYKASDKGFSSAAGFVVDEEISNITGFDYDVTLSKFAISSPDKVIFIDKKGKKLNVVSYGTKATSAGKEIATTYDFNNHRLCVLNITDKTLKMISLEKSVAHWKRRFESDSGTGTPRSMCLYKDKLCVSCGDSIAILSATSGTPIIKHNTQHILDDCFGICVIDEVLVLSSNSDNFEKSSTLAYISL